MVSFQQRGNSLQSNDFFQSNNFNRILIPRFSLNFRCVFENFVEKYFPTEDTVENNIGTPTPKKRKVATSRSSTSKRVSRPLFLQSDSDSESDATKGN